MHIVTGKIGKPALTDAVCKGTRIANFIQFR